jgi:peptide/nickel transport system permease protein
VASAPLGGLADSEFAGEARSYWSRAFGRFLQHRFAVASLVILVLIFAAGLLASRLTPYGYQEVNLHALNSGPSWSHPFGADQLGRDYLSRTLYGIGTSAQVALLVGFLCVRRRSRSGRKSSSIRREPRERVTCASSYATSCPMRLVRSRRRRR